MSFDVLRRLILTLNGEGARRGLTDRLRRLRAAIGRTRPAQLVEAFKGIEETSARFDAAAALCLDAEDFERAGCAGYFDACDLRHWLLLAQKAGVDAIPAGEILRLTQAEAERASGTVDIDDFLPRRLRARLASALSSLIGGDRVDAPPVEPASRAVDPSLLSEKIAAALDDVPEGWMVRHVRAGPSSLKALAGAGVAPLATHDLETPFGAAGAVGPGWLRRGNRRHVDVADSRTVDVAMAQGPDGDQVFVARPWIVASRWTTGPDPHRHGTPFAGKGAWPAEWRAFFFDGRVEAVSYYYAWAGAAGPEDARMALEVRKRAQRVVDVAVRSGAKPVYFGAELMRGAPRAPEWLERDYPLGVVNGTLDFIETANGPILLEGGPAWAPLPIGGAHPCGFAGIDGRPAGAALKLMPGVLLAEFSTWRETDRAGAILDWDEVAELAATGATKGIPPAAA